MYLKSSYRSAVDWNIPSRVFSNFVEFQIDYSRPLDDGGWTMVYNLGDWARDGVRWQKQLRWLDVASEFRWVSVRGNGGGAYLCAAAGAFATQARQALFKARYRAPSGGADAQSDKVSHS